jgi:hypothetical protein
MQPHPVQRHQTRLRRRASTPDPLRPSSLHLRITLSLIRTTAGPHGGDHRCRWASAIGAAAVTAGAGTATGATKGIGAMDIGVVGVVMAAGVGTDTQDVAWATAAITGAVAEATGGRIER